MTLRFELRQRSRREFADATSRDRAPLITASDGRLQGATLLSTDAPSQEITIGYFGASTGGAARLVGAAAMSSHLGAVVSRGGRSENPSGAFDEEAIEHSLAAATSA